jgi:hypothetical protein
MKIMKNDMLKNLSEAIEQDIGIKINSIDDIRQLLLYSENTEIRSSMAYYIAEYKISELLKEVITILCASISKGNDSTLIYASRQFECSQYFKVYIALILDRSYHSCIECYLAIRKCRNISIDDLSNAKDALENWYYFHNIPEFADVEVIEKRNLIYEIWEYIENRIRREKKKD